jgi:hypothetical protein
MLSHRRCTAAFTALALAAPAAGAQEPEPTDFAALRAAIVPCESELQWQKIPWRASLWHAVLEGRATRRPILLWAMNGHPLACT